ncbi:RNA polymerase sigma-70 factor (ECF subfamily) [Pedobacter psychrotolerans]|uniref:DNA-directed RNA polymerase sigma-70 factor n=1 Tax=Pedobacter psychrotolerans TaxID=1843235 RepID=A0A4R2HK99_9SPHI|nr:sigma-70 family RNA polymerase sigma factor [Pedobacter psychrotolerans]TCO28868.1 RNA polymerase sigma-70 factor (ECF subfamily) [Pedobacter psychrotolerans]GGE52445.1 DNA-directed RNA polymerase sigma-70 factor [Pedobacter psychrotolerans]
MTLSSDSSLFTLIKAGNHLAYAKLIDLYWEELYRHIFKKIKNSDDAKDIVQDIFLSLWKNRLNIVVNESDSLAPYLFRSAKYAIINHFSRPGITIADEQALSAALQAPSAIKTDDLLLIGELQKLVENEISQLPERLQVPYRLSREQDLPVREIAEKLSLSEQTVKNNISAALSAIRFKLGKYNAEGTIVHILAMATLLHHK